MTRLQCYYENVFRQCRMLSKFKKYAEFGATASPPNQRRQPLISAKPNAFSLLLLEISKQFEVEDEMNFKAFLEDYGQEDDKGALTAEQIQKQPTIYRLLMESAKVDFIQSDDLSNLEAFLDICGHCALVQEIQEFQTQQGKCTLLQSQKLIYCTFLCFSINKVIVSHLQDQHPLANPHVADIP